MYKFVRLLAGNSSGKEREVLFSIRASGVAQRWAGILDRANRESRIRESKRWYNFSPDFDSAEAELVSKIEETVLQINKYFPSLIGERLPGENAQDWVNRTHKHFADTAASERYVTAKTAGLWNELNNILHALESSIRSKSTLDAAGIPEANIVLTWENAFSQPLEQSDYEEFTVAKKFGTVYVNYCHTGRHLYEMFLADDKVAADEHIVPLRAISADTYLWFGTTTGPNSLTKRKLAIHEWFLKNELRLNRLGFHWGDPKLAIGWIPVADIQGDFSGLESQLSLIDELKDVQEVKALQVL